MVLSQSLYPFSLGNITLTHHNKTAFYPGSSSNQVSWQSAMWPVIACMLLVMTQDSGRVSGVSPEYSVAFRASPLVCIVDVLMICAEFICLLVAGCPISKAARHVWYNRYAIFTQGTRQASGPWKLANLDLISSQQEDQDQSDPGVVGDSGYRDDDNSLVPADSSSRSTTTTPIPNTAACVSRHSSQCHEDGDEIRTFQEHGMCSNAAHHLHSPSTSNCTICSAPEASSSTSRTSEPTDLELSMTDISQLYPVYQISFYPNSGISRSWRLSISAFTLGALPQIIKVAGMRGIPWTQAYVFAYALSFLIPELFRLMAGEAGLVELGPPPLSPRAAQMLFTAKVLLIFAAIHGSIFKYCYHISAAFTLATVPLMPSAMPVVIIVCFGAALGWILTPLAVRTVMHAGWLRRTSSSNWLPRISLPQTLTNVFATLQQVPISLFDLRPAVLTTHNFSIAISFTTITLLSIFVFALGTQPIFPVFLTKLVFTGGIGVLFISLNLLTFFTVLLIYRALFVGAYSRIPRRLTGMRGTRGEFACAYFVLLAVAGTVAEYGFSDWDAGGTYKPGWAENLG